MAEIDSLKIFRKDLRRARKMLTLERTTHRNPPRLSEEIASEGLRASVAILTVASYEAFLGNLAQELADFIKGLEEGLAFSRYPENMQVFLTLEVLERAIRGGRNSGSKRVDRIPNVKAAAKLVNGSSIDSAAFGFVGGNADVEGTKRVFSRFGIEDPLKHIAIRRNDRCKNKIPERLLKDKINSIVLRRHQVAHGGSAASYSLVDLHEGILIINEVAAAGDFVMRRHVRELIRNARQ